MGGDARYVAELKATCVQFIRGMFEVVRETDAWRHLDEALKREVTEISGARGGRG